MAQSKLVFLLYYGTCCTGCRKTHNKPNVNVNMNVNANAQKQSQRQRQRQRQRGVCVMAPMWVTWVSERKLITSFNDRWPCLELQDNAQQICQPIVGRGRWRVGQLQMKWVLSLSLSLWKSNVNCSAGAHWGLLRHPMCSEVCTASFFMWRI